MCIICDVHAWTFLRSTCGHWFPAESWSNSSPLLVTGGYSGMFLLQAVLFHWFTSDTSPCISIFTSLISHSPSTYSDLHASRCNLHLSIRRRLCCCHCALWFWRWGGQHRQHCWIALTLVHSWWAIIIKCCEEICRRGWTFIKLGWNQRLRQLRSVSCLAACWRAATLRSGRQYRSWCVTVSNISI